MAAEANIKVDTAQVRKRYKDCLKAIRNHLCLRGHPTEEIIHELRVNLKSINALISMLQFNGVKIPAKRIKVFRTLFRTSGRLRSAQIQFAIMNKYFSDESLNPNYLHQLHEDKIKRLNEYSKFLRTGISKTLEIGIKTLKKKIGEMTRRQIVRYLIDGEQKLIKRLKRSIFREQELHIARKDLKKYYLNLTMCLPGSSKQQLEGILDLLGKWHDLQIAFDHIIKTIYTGNLTESESEPIRKIKDNLVRDKGILYERLVSLYTERIRIHDRLTQT